MNNQAKVFLVGAGPGDPDLLTVKAQRLLREVDVVVYDRLVSDAILAQIPAGVSRICVGKASGRHSMAQADINALLVRLARADHSVVRLKGGDPFVFGRGSEEAAYLHRHGIAFEVVPGITAASACSAYAGIPLTHRGLSRGVRLVTGHCRDDRPLDLDWSKLADPDATLVIYMGLANLDTISRQLIAAGLGPDTPAAAIAQGTTRQQRVCRTSLRELPDAVRTQALQSPVTLIVGKVVQLAPTLAWFEADANELDPDELDPDELDAGDMTANA